MSGKDWKQVKEIFHDALRRRSDEREAYLESACLGDINLRIEVESLLISLNDAKSFLEAPIVKTSETPRKWQLQPRQSISHYEIVEPIGVGGMGEVYLARDTNLRRQVALKILPKEMLNDRSRLNRFQREALAVSALNHPNILTIFEFGSENGIQLFASEYIMGETLRKKLDRGPVELDDALDIAVQIASALNAAHSAGVIHRDIKPENIMIRDDGYVKVLDFGLAKLTGETETGPRRRAQSFSTPGMIMGTATYMSPEQARSRPLDGRTDVFSLGIVLYELLFGYPPFLGETASDVVAAIVQAEPEFSEGFGGTYSDTIEEILRRALEKDTAERYQTVSEMLQDLRMVKKEVDFGIHEAVISQKMEIPDETESNLSSEVVEPNNGKRIAIYIFAALLFLVLLVLIAYSYLG
jgi:eukaryotic-like serine/threonine-protein kinase